MSRYLQRKFEQLFSRGLGFWTSEDGTLMTIVITRRPDWQEVMQFEFSHVFTAEQFDPKRAKERFVQQEWVGKEYFDGGCQKRGKVWRTTDNVTEFPVIEYELQIPR